MMTARAHPVDPAFRSPAQEAIFRVTHAPPPPDDHLSIANQIRTHCHSPDDSSWTWLLLFRDHLVRAAAINNILSRLFFVSLYALLEQKRDANVHQSQMTLDLHTSDAGHHDDVRHLRECDLDHQQLRNAGGLLKST